MTELEEKPQQRLGRPRAFSDTEAFIATAKAIQKHGYKALSMSDIATELGCTAPAIMSRFGSKRGLLQAYQQWGNATTAERFRHVRKKYSSPLQALRSRLYESTPARPDELGNIETQINVLGFHVLAWTDPDLHDLEAERRAMFLYEITSLLQAAVDAGELQGCDPESLGGAMVAAIAGATLQWIPNPAPDPETHLLSVIDELLRPYVVDCT